MQDIAIVLGGRLKPAAKLMLANYAVYEEIKIIDAGRLVRELEARGIQAIISTGGTIPEICRHVRIPVVSANLTYFDLLETLREMELALEIQGKKVAMLLHCTLSVQLERLQPFVKNRVDLYQYRDEAHLAGIIDKLTSENYDVLVGGPTTEYYAKQYNARSFLLRFGEETMNTAVQKALSVLEATKKDREQHQRLQTVFDIFPDGILATDQNGNIIMCNPNALNILQLPADDVVGKKVYQVTKDSSWEDVYIGGAVQSDLIREYQGRKIFMTRQPIFANNKIIGAVGTLQEAARIEKLEHEYRKIQTKGLVARYTFRNIVAKSVTMQDVIEQARAYANVDSTILIEGETGTGKEVFAQSIHNQSRRCQGPFVAINCAALPETLLESELMGHEEGAFTGAKRGGKAGLFELAHKGTIFLDEINQIPLALQARVLRVIQERVVMRLGGEKIIPVDVHIIAATNEDLAGKVRRSEFRDDLYYRLNVLTLTLPPLRERREDIPLLLKHYLAHYCSTYGAAATLSSEAVLRLTNYNWPGNIRELTNFVERFVVRSLKGALQDLPFVKDYIGKGNLADRSCPAAEADVVSLRIDNLKKMEHQILQQVLDKCGGNRLQAAIILGISRTTLWSRLKEISSE